MIEIKEMASWVNFSIGSVLRVAQGFSLAHPDIRNPEGLPYRTAPYRTSDSLKDLPRSRFGSPDIKAKALSYNKLSPSEG